MSELRLLHDVSVALASSTNFRTALPRLARAVHRHVAVVEVEIAELDPRRDAVCIRAYAPQSSRRWAGQRSVRFLERQEIDAPTWSEGGDLARVGLAEIASQFKLPLGPAGRRGLLTISFEARDPIPEDDHRARFVETLAQHCSALLHLSATAQRCRLAHLELKKRNVGGVAQPENTEIPVNETMPAPSSVPTQDTDISVTTIDQALIACISRALDATDGKIYGEDGAAALLGLKPSTLQSKMRKLGIERRSFVA